MRHLRKPDFVEEGSYGSSVCENAGLTGEPTAGGLLNRLPATLADG